MRPSLTFRQSRFDAPSSIVYHIHQSAVARRFLVLHGGRFRNGIRNINTHDENALDKNKVESLEILNSKGMKGMASLQIPQDVDRGVVSIPSSEDTNPALEAFQNPTSNADQGMQYARPVTRTASKYTSLK
jgi:hypothetical protein